MTPQTQPYDIVDHHFGEKLRKTALGMKVTRDTYGCRFPKSTALLVQSHLHWNFMSVGGTRSGVVFEDQ